MTNKWIRTENLIFKAKMAIKGDKKAHETHHDFWYVIEHIFCTTNS